MYVLHNMVYDTYMRKIRIMPFVAATAIAAAFFGTPLASATETKDQPATCSHAVNGMPIRPQSDMQQWEVAGVKFGTAPGEATTMLRDFTQWFHRNIEPITMSTNAKTGDDWSWAASKPINGPGTPCSNHGAGAAIDLNAERHGFKKWNTFTPWQTAKIRMKLLSYHGKIQWGGNWTDPRDEMHFEYVPSGKPTDSFMWIDEFVPGSSSRF